MSGISNSISNGNILPDLFWKSIILDYFFDNENVTQFRKYVVCVGCVQKYTSGILEGEFRVLLG